MAPEGTTFVAPLGTGSVAIVARVRVGEEELACKRLLPHHRDELPARLSLVREAKSLELARHPSLPALRGVGSDAAGPFVLESVVEGLALRVVKARWGGRLPRRLALHIAAEATRALQEIHALEDALGAVDLVHGDLGPDNLWLGPHGEVAFLDLGNARFRGFAADLDSGERGTAPYLAPELARGEGSATQSTDAYALAATVAWLLLDGDQPLSRAENDAALLAEIGEGGIAAAALGPLDEPLRSVLAGLLAFDPGDREVDLSALLRALQALP